MGLGVGLLKTLVFITNTVAFIFGGLLLGLGIFIKVVDLDSGLALEEFLDVINENVYDIAVWTLIILGAVVFIMGFLGCYGTCQESSCMLCTAAIIMSCLVALEVIAVIYGGILMGNLDDKLEGEMARQIREDYYNETSPDPESRVWNTLQEGLECCGAKNYLDYRNSTFSLTGNPVPYTCCIPASDNATNTECMDEAMSGIDPECKNSDPNNGNWTQLNPCGCYAPVADELDTLAAGFVAVTAVAAVCQAVLVAFTCCLMSSIKSSRSKVGYA